MSRVVEEVVVRKGGNFLEERPSDGRSVAGAT